MVRIFNFMYHNKEPIKKGENMTKEQMIEKWVQNSRFVNKKWGAIAYRVKDSIEYLSEVSNLSLKKLLLRIGVEEYQSGKEEDTCNTLYIFIAAKDVKHGRWSKWVNVYLTLDKRFLKKKVREKLFPHSLVCLDSNKLKELE